MRLKCVDPYRAGSVTYDMGQEFEVDDEHGAWLCRDSPGCFQVIQTVDKALSAPPEDKMQRPVQIRARIQQPRRRGS